MKNIKMSVKDNILTLEVDLTKKYGASKSGKSMVIASSEGNVSVPSTDDVKIGINVYTSMTE